MKTELKYDYLKIEFGLPEDCRIEKANNGYYRIMGLDHPLKSPKSGIALHRYILFEHLGRPEHSPCHWCGYVVPWNATLHYTTPTGIYVSHKDGNTENNNPENLITSCTWCSSNRNWAEQYPEFWSNWRRWMKDVPPVFRPNLILIAEDHGIFPFDYENCEMAHKLRPDEIEKTLVLKRNSVIIRPTPKKNG